MVRSDVQAALELLASLARGDSNLKIDEIVDIANSKGSGWVEYKWYQPATRQVLPKVVYFDKVDDVIICSGVYKE